MKKNITVKSGTRTGSLKWFANQKWEILRTSLDEINPDVVLVRNEDEVIVFVENNWGAFELDSDMSTPIRIGDALECQLFTFVKEVLGDITTDDDAEFELSIITK